MNKIIRQSKALIRLNNLSYKDEIKYCPGYAVVTDKTQVITECNNQIYGDEEICPNCKNLE